MSLITRTTNRTGLNEILQFQALLLACHKIAITLKIVNYKKFDVVPKLTGGQKVLSKMIMIQPIQALSDLSQHRLNTYIVLNNYATVPKFDMLQYRDKLLGTFAVS